MAQRLEATGLDVTGRPWVVSEGSIPRAEMGSVRLEGIRPSLVGPTLAAIAGVLAAVAGIRMAVGALGAHDWTPTQLLPGLEVMVAGLFVVAAGTTFGRRERVRWKVIETTPMGERVILATHDHALAERVLARFHEARSEAARRPRGEVRRWRV